ncbi:MAG: hypothetical protein ACYDCL_01750 [Myxococcales bacterium]
MRWFALVISCLMAAACSGGGGGSSGGGSSGATTGGGGSGGATTSGGGSGGATTGGGTGSATGGSTGGLPYGGFVIFGMTAETASLSVFTGEAGFYTAWSFSCAGGTQQGSCCYQSASAAKAEGKTTPPADVPAGAVTLTDGSATLASLPFVAGKGYTSASSTQTSSFSWKPGDTLGVTAAGDVSGIDAFSATLTAPAALAALSPDPTTLKNVARGSDFILTWTAVPGSERVVLDLSASTGAAADGVIVCSAPASGGTLTVPAALLSSLSSGDNGSLELSVKSQDYPTIGDATVEVSAQRSLLAQIKLQ